MSSVQVSGEGVTEARRDETPDMKLEVLGLPVSDVDRAKSFYEVKTRLPGRVTGATYESTAELEQALVRADAAHGKHEEKTGERDAEWPSWYARYMTSEQTGEGLRS
jgi:hypothetical protein